MQKCLNCGKETKNNYFCSRSCAATINNKNVHRKEKTKKCKNCYKFILSNLTYCSDECREEGLLKNHIPDNEIFIEHCPYKRKAVKRYFMRKISNECSICGQQPIWFGQKLIMVLDHINGINDDCRITNLRLLCPNCNSQTQTFSGRNIKFQKLT